MELSLIFCLSLAFLFSGVRPAEFIIVNNCAFTIWPGILSGSGEGVNPSGFELSLGESRAVDVKAPWSGRVWGRTGCKNDPSGRFTCESADCGTGRITCDGSGSIPPASLAEFTVKANGQQDFYDISLVDGYNLPVSITPQGGSGDCKLTSCPAEVNPVCPSELALKSSDGTVVGCKSACLAFNEPRYCCTGSFNQPTTCPPTKYSKIFKDRCPQAYSYAYDDSTSTFTCSGRPDYTITFCP